MTDSRVHCPSCHRKATVTEGRYDAHRRRGRQGARCSQSGELVVAVSEAA